MRIRVDGAKCQGNARCWALAPDMFELNDEGYMEEAVIDVPDGDQEKASRAVRACPERALTLIDD
ncbi:MAG: ferredoxin [Novosphingobium sp.]|nr:ferredoxin [Novosphingobium sp.]